MGCKYGKLKSPTKHQRCKRRPTRHRSIGRRVKSSFCKRVRRICG